MKNYRKKKLYHEHKKWHTCEESGEHLRISLLEFIDELEKQIIKETGEVGP